MKRYEKPSIELEILELEDICVVSGGSTTNGVTEVFNLGANND